MKNLMLWMIAFAILPGSALQAQNLTGNWQGTLEAGPQKLRIVVKISLEDDKLKATLYSIDQPAPGMPASAVTKDGSTIKIAVGGLGSYEGKLSGDGNAILGTWTQGAPMPLNLVRATPATAWTTPEPPPPPVRMAANADPAFEVATIKPSDPARPGKVFTVRGQDVMTVNTTLNDLITVAYGVHARQITGGPSWLDSDKYDVTGRPDVPGQPSVAQIKIMLQKLVADRFQLKFHREKKEISVYAIGVAKSGAKISKSQADPNGLPSLFFGGAGPGGGDELQCQERDPGGSRQHAAGHRPGQADGGSDGTCREVRFHPEVYARCGSDGRLWGGPSLPRLPTIPMRPRICSLHSSNNWG